MQEVLHDCFLSGAQKHAEIGKHWGKNELVGVKFNFGAYSLIFACYTPGLCGFRGIF